jgi:hypothetical protein
VLISLIARTIWATSTNQAARHPGDMTHVIAIPNRLRTAQACGQWDNFAIGRGPAAARGSVTGQGSGARKGGVAVGSVDEVDGGGPLEEQLVNSCRLFVAFLGRLRRHNARFGGDVIGYFHKSSKRLRTRTSLVRLIAPTTPPRPCRTGSCDPGSAATSTAIGGRSAP